MQKLQVEVNSGKKKNDRLLVNVNILKVSGKKQTIELKMSCVCQTDCCQSQCVNPQFEQPTFVNLLSLVLSQVKTCFTTKTFLRLVCYCSQVCLEADASDHASECQALGQVCPMIGWSK